MKLFVVALCVAVCSAAKLDNTYLPPGSARTAGGSGSFLAAPRGGSGFGGGSSFGGKTTFGGSSSFGGKTTFGGGSSFGSKHSFSSGSFGKTSGFGGAAVAAPAQTYGAPGGGNYRAGGGHSAGPQIPIVRFNNDNNGDGNYRFEYETGNGIQAQEAGQQKSGGQEDINDVHGSFAYTGDDGQQYSISYVADENGFQPQGAHLPTPPPIPEEILKSLQENAADEARGIVDDGSYNSGAHGGSGSYGGAGSYNAGGHGGSGSHGGAAGYGSSNRGGSGSFGGSAHGGSSFGGSFGGKTSGGFGNAGANKQYLAPRKPSFNSNTGYNY